MAFIRIFPSVFSFLLCFRLIEMGVFSTEASMELEHLYVAVDVFLDFLGVMPGA
jgi:hypothetical protein